MSWLLWWRPPYLYRTVMVNLIAGDDTAIQGVLWASRGGWLVLRKAAVVERDHAPLPVDGEVLVPRANVHFVQVLP